jgi:hypothetical protein
VLALAIVIFIQKKTMPTAALSPREAV